MMYPSDFSNPCYHHDITYESGYAHDQTTCDHVPEMVSVAPFDGYCMHSNDACGYNMFSWSQHVPDASLPMPSQTFCPIHKHHDHDGHNVKKIYDEISAECEHFLLKKNCTECRDRVVIPIQNKSHDTSSVDVALNRDSREVSLETGDEEGVEEMTKLALSMKRKREQNKRAAARYRERKKSKFDSAKVEINALEQKRQELQKLVDYYGKEIKKHRQILGLPAI